MLLQNNFFINKRKYSFLYAKYKDYTMIPKNVYIDNLKLIHSYKECIINDIVECGTWKGGMIAGITDLLNGRNNIHLFDSFEGLPDAKDIDGEAAIEWQKDTNGSWYFDNCTADINFAEECMKRSKSNNYTLHKGWFNETLPEYAKLKPTISVLRLDGDWYDSTMECLNNLFPYVHEGGLIIIDDYLFWDGCTKAVHDYLSRNGLREKIRTYNNTVAYIIKLK